MEFNNTIAVVTGGGSGLGRGICHELAEKGSLVFVIDINKVNAKKTADEIGERQLNAVPYCLDITKYKDLIDFGKEVEKNYGLIDYWVNNAGISKITSFFNHTEELWNSTMDINLKGQFLSCKIAIDHMMKKGKGSIVNLSSQSGKVGTSSYQAYCSSKFGVIGLTQSLSKEFASYEINVNSVAPGVIYTPMWEKQKEDYAMKKNLNPKEVMNYFKSKIPANRLGTVEDVAKTVSFLLSNDASYITGQNINVNGGDIMH